MSARIVGFGFAGLAIALLCISLFQHALFSGGVISKPIWLLDADVETSIPTWLAVILLYSVSVALLTTALETTEDPTTRNLIWPLLSVAFVILSLDEYLALHERFTPEAAASLGLSASLAAYADWWPILVALLGLLVLRLLWQLPSGTRYGFILAGLLYGMGVVGMDVLVPAILGPIDHNTLLGATLVTIEEGFELAGTILMLFYVLRYREVLGFIAALEAERLARRNGAVSRTEVV